MMLAFGSTPGMFDPQMPNRVNDMAIQAMRAVVGNEISEMDIVHSLHLARNDVQMAINILFDTPGFRHRSPVKAPIPRSSGGATRRHSAGNNASRASSSPSTVKAESRIGSTATPVQVESHVANHQVAHSLSEAGFHKSPDDHSLKRAKTEFESDISSVKAECCGFTPSLEIGQPTESDHQEDSKAPLEAEASGPEQVEIEPPEENLGLSQRRTFITLDDADENWSGMFDVPDETRWWLLDETIVTVYSTCRGSRIKIGEFVSFNFPKADSKVIDKRPWSRARPASEIVRFSTAACGEIGRLPADWAKCLIPLVHSGKITIRGRCKSAPTNLSLMSSILLDLRIYINHSYFMKYKGTASIEETIFRPLPSLMQLLGKTPLRKAEFTPEDLNVYTRKRLQTSEEVSPAKRPKNESSEAEDAVMADSEVDHVVGTSDSRELQEMEPPEGLECQLRPYQKQALFWMSNLEVGVTREDAARTLHPCWSEYSLADRRASAFYVNAFSGEATLDFPSALQTARGGILADAMGMGKTVMTISLLLLNRGKGSAEQEQLPELRGKSSSKIPELKPNTRKGGGTLIICPMTLLSQWQSELQTHVSSGTFSVYAYYGQDRIRDVKFLAKQDVVLTTYGVVQSECSNNGNDGPIHLIHWFRVVLDEAHTIKASKSASAQAVFKLAADRRLCLTGTPVQNKLEDMYSLLYFLRVEPWCNWGWWHKLIQKPYEEGDERGLNLLQAILKPLMLRRTKDSTDKDGKPILVLPSADFEVIECELSDAERDFYDALYRKSKVKFDQFVEQGKVLHNYASILELLLRLRQACDHPFLVLSRGDTDEYADLGKLARRFLDSGSSQGQAPSTAFVKEVVEDIRKGESMECPICLEVPEDAILTPCAHRMCRECVFNSWRTNGGGLCPICRRPCSRQDLITVPTSSRFRINVEEQWTESSKVSALLKHLTMLQEAGSKSVVFSQWTAFLDLLEIPLKRKRFRYVRLDGSLSHQKRQEVLKEFSGNPMISIMLISLKAGGVGLNLTAASTAFLLDPWWNPAVEEQAIMRIHRIGQTKKVSIKRFIVKGSVEEKMQQVQARKQRLIAGALTDEEVRHARIEELKMLFR